MRPSVLIASSYQQEFVATSQQHLTSKIYIKSGLSKGVWYVYSVVPVSCFAFPVHMSSKRKLNFVAKMRKQLFEATAFMILLHYKI